MVGGLESLCFQHILVSVAADCNDLAAFERKSRILRKSILHLARNVKFLEGVIFFFFSLVVY